MAEGPVTIHFERNRMPEKRKVLESSINLGQFFVHAREILYEDESGAESVEVWIVPKSGTWTAPFPVQEDACLALSKGDVKALRDFLGILDLT